MAAVVDSAEPRPQLDYYLLLSPADGRPLNPEGIVIEEFVRDRHCVTVGLHNAGWTPADGRWWSSASFSRGMRTDPELSGRVTPVGRGAAEAAYRRLGGGRLPAEAVLRSYFRDYEPFAVAPPLRLGPADAPDGFHEKRVYRVLFAKDLRADQLANLTAVWRTPADGELADPAAWGFPAGRLRVGGDLFAWNLRRIDRNLAWCLDLTASLATDADDAVGPVLHELTSVLRQQGLIPVTTERFA
ncbi:hypothetical protein EV384_5075 [Micromonospora kangleipakensis]|uniref:Uncharacterized protein n=1 Tax=Micromonospora kangleipakensis TaxID=1077942 RepID=A0A4Q8BGQ7_9ACTN|nr:hypothetical protein [Micromonospora kangleipakensis]RZU76419.1 hypothetical protein EV384_5075 [Micromonospora kangleipakensis]